MTSRAQPAPSVAAASACSASSTVRPCAASAWRRKSRSLRNNLNRLTTDQVMATPVAGSTVTLGGADSTASAACGLTGGAIACAQLGAAAPRASAKPVAAMVQRNQTDIQNFAKVESP